MKRVSEIATDISSIDQNIRRKKWIDSLRAVAMILVVYGHCVKGWTVFYVFTSPVKMPLFFVISGYLFNPRNGDIKAFLKNLFHKLVVPWLILGMIHPTNPLSRFLDLLSGKALWFMPCLIIGEIVWFFIRKYANKDWQVVVFGFIVGALGYLLSQYHILDCAMLNTAFIVQIFFIIGYLFHHFEDQILNKWGWILSLGLVLYLCLTVMSLYVFPGSFIDVHLNYYINILYAVCVILLGCLVLFVGFRHYNIGTKWLSYIGQNTLVIYIVHGMGINLFAKVIPEGLLGLPLPFYAFFRMVFALIVCCLLAGFLDRFFPIVVGKRGSIR